MHLLNQISILKRLWMIHQPSRASKVCNKRLDLNKQDIFTPINKHFKKEPLPIMTWILIIILDIMRLLNNSSISQANYHKISLLLKCHLFYKKISYHILMRLTWPKPHRKSLIFLKDSIRRDMNVSKMSKEFQNIANNIHLNWSYRLQLLATLTTSAVDASFGKDFILNRVLSHSFKKHAPQALHDTDLIWKINHKLRKRNVSK